jgi:hypothetical protein
MPWISGLASSLLIVAAIVWTLVLIAESPRDQSGGPR